MAEGQERLHTISANTIPIKVASMAAKSTASCGTRDVSQVFTMWDAVFVVQIVHLERKIRANSVSKANTAGGQVSLLSVNRERIVMVLYATLSAKKIIKAWGQCAGSDVPMA